MCELDLKACDMWDEKERTARKEHRCSDCHIAIRPGERYTAHFSTFEGEVCTGKVCGCCRAARDEFAAAHEGMHPQPGSLIWMLEECIAEGDDESERRWKPMLAAIRARAGAPRP